MWAPVAFAAVLASALLSEAAHLGLRRAAPAVSEALVSAVRTEGRRAGVCAAGEPTDFAYSGCVKTSKLHEEVKYTGSRRMTVNDCFVFCMKKQKAQYFGISKGKQCWCAALHEGSRVDNSKCDYPCEGKDTQMCGGIDTSSVYVMFDCTPPTDEEKAAADAKRKEEILAGYSSLAKQTCGKAADNQAMVNGAATMIGSVEECKLACSRGGGSMECHGFTFEDDLSKCSFHMDVLDGEPVKGNGKSCFFKTLGL